MINQNDSFENTQNEFLCGIAFYFFLPIYLRPSFHRSVRGFTLLALGGTVGYSFVPVDFPMLSSGKETNRYQEIWDEIDKRINGFKGRKEAISKKSEVAVQLVRNALNHGIRTDYVLMDTWFTNEPMLKAFCGEGFDVIGIVQYKTIQNMNLWRRLC